MFTPDSRYAGQATYPVALPDGRQVTAIVPPMPDQAPLAGYHLRAGEGRLDLVAVQYLNCLLYTSPSPRDGLLSRMPSSA